MRTKLHKIFALLTTLAVLMVMLPGNPLPASPMVRVIIQGHSVEAAAQAARNAGGRVLDDLGIINAVAAEAPQASLARLAVAEGVVRVTLDRAVEVTGQGHPVNVEFAKSIGAAEVWEAGNLGQGVTVAVLDTGFDPTMQGLKHGADGNNNRILAYYDAVSDEFYGSQHLQQSPRDPSGHGTHVAGIVGNSESEPWDDGEYRGVAPAANLVAVKVLDETGAGTYIDILRGMNWVIQNKDVYDIRVLNISLYTQPRTPYWADPFDLAVMVAWKAGIVVVTSAGNGGPDPLSIGVPGNTPYVITVGAFTDHYTPDDFGDDYMPPFSACGPTLDAFVKPDVIAPGAHMVSLMRPNTYLSNEYPDHRINGTYFQVAGTSMSTAAVSGIVALMLSENPDLTPDQVKYRLTMTARPQFSEATGEAAYSVWQQGAGRVWVPDAVFTDIEGAANQGMDLAADLAGTTHYQGWAAYDPALGGFYIQGYEGWAGGYEGWAGGYEGWAGGYEGWAGGTTNWSGDFNDWVTGYEGWAGGYNPWAGGYEGWAGGYEGWAGGYEGWAGGYEGWAGGYEGWAGGYEGWAGGYEGWAGGYEGWAGGYEGWAGSYDEWIAAFADSLNIPADSLRANINQWVDGGE